jgi:acyl-CoA synthetase (AMP-forming)/AMP-acid ligase II
MNKPELRAKCEERAKELLPLLSDYVSKWARERGDKLALIEYDTGAEITWKKFEQAMDAFAAKLLSMGLKKGDVIATSLPLLKEHVFLEYACFKTGIIIAPLDLRLKAVEVKDAFDRVKPKAYFFLGKTPRADFRPIVEEVMKSAPYCKTWVQFQPEAEGIIQGAQYIKDFAKDIKWKFIFSKITGSVKRANKKVGKRDPALLIFTTGSTGSPKPAMLCHENILLQNVGLVCAFGIDPGEIMLVNLPPSHVGCQTEQLMTPIYAGELSVIMHIFDAEKTLDAIRKHKVTIFGQIPALFAMQWRLPNYDDYDLSSLRFALYGGQAVDRPFLEKLRTMAPLMGSGLGLTETAGFVTYTPTDWKVDEIGDSIGFDCPLCPISIREVMQADGKAGKEKPAGEIGEICFSGPQIFLGYMHAAANTKKTISTDGYCYTGDIGFYNDTGLHFAGRSKFVIKPKGYQVFPAEVENFITDNFKDRVLRTGCVGVKHDVFTEAIVACVELKKGTSLSREELDAKMKDVAAYKRPSHYIFIEEGEMPLNRVAKVDVLELKKKADAEIEGLRKQGKWDKA